MATLTVTSRGQVTFRKEVLGHLGIKPGDKIEVDPMPDGYLSVHASRPKGKIEDLFGLLKGKARDKKVMTIEEINEVIADGWAGKL
jgi:antitoxin PrlF